MQCACGVPRKHFTQAFCNRYAPRQLKNQQYSETGKLNVEVKFAPFSCKRRRAPLRVRSNQSLISFKLMAVTLRMSRIERSLSLYINRYSLRYSWSTSPSPRSMSSSQSWRTMGWKAVSQLDQQSQVQHSQMQALRCLGWLFHALLLVSRFIP